MRRRGFLTLLLSPLAAPLLRRPEPRPISGRYVITSVVPDGGTLVKVGDVVDLNAECAMWYRRAAENPERAMLRADGYWS